MKSNLVKHGEFMLENYEVLFIDAFKEKHSLTEALSILTNRQQERVKGALRAGRSDLALAYKDFVNNAPIHPEANKVVILDNLVWLMNRAKKEEDTQGVLRAITEINKMIKGNLASTSEKKVIETKLIGIIDMTKREETKFIDV